MAGNSFLTSSQTERYPHFAQLLEDLLENRVCPDNFVTKSKNEEMQKVSQDYQRTRNEYEAVKLVYDSIWEIIADSSLEGDLHKKLEEALISSELDKSLKVVKENTHQSDVCFQPFGVGIKQQCLDDDVKLWAQGQLKNKVVETGVDLLQQLGQDTQGNNKDLLMAKLNQLPSLVSCKLETLKSAKEIMGKNHQTLKEQYTKYTSTLLESLQIMENLLQKDIIEIQKEQYVSKRESLEAQCDALCLKIKSLHLEILCETYTKDTVPALKKIKKEMETKGEHFENEIREAKTRLTRYESVGQEFNCIVNEYSKLREAIKQKKWTLQKLKSYCP